MTYVVIKSVSIKSSFDIHVQWSMNLYSSTQFESLLLRDTKNVNDPRMFILASRL